MLAFIKGEVIAKRLGSIIVENNNLGYQIMVGEKIWEEANVGETIKLFLHHHLREDSDELYGFTDLETLSLFELLLSVSGIGPKSALNILSLADIKDVQQAIILGDEVMLTKVSGIGRKTAERVILELKNKIASLPDNLLGNHAGSTNEDDLEALIALGYSAPAARRALAKVDRAVTNPAERLKLALKELH
ncbi:MAG: Holliday junction ATP-dependent DNA helicase RuvA [Parcubacteria group bacterium ADurb.Bin016]|nr:MAG: Holliday junction ATP-dependent DNA helicase RuvA [Parcubacteria group bacterium ADurb.Bin016]HPD08110.1 Holliday junction branch migration protein RuvA [bacterium]HRT11243.1 Holliday junction branch migration protein RuvA [Patescibacteria group bacterium]